MSIHAAEIQAMLHDMAVATQRREIDRIKADPAAHKLTLIMDAGKPASYRYWSAGRDGRGWEVRFAYTCWRNAAGYFLSFREVIPPPGSSATHRGKRDQFAARKVRRRAADLARRRAERFREARNGKE